MARTGLGSRADGLSNADYLRNLSRWANGRAEGGRGLFRRVPRRFPGSSRTIQLLTLLRFQPGALLPPSQERTHSFHFHPQHSRLSSGLRRASPFTTPDAENALQLPTSPAPRASASTELVSLCHAYSLDSAERVFELARGIRRCCKDTADNQKRSALSYWLRGTRHVEPAMEGSEVQ